MGWREGRDWSPPPCPSGCPQASSSCLAAARGSRTSATRASRISSSTSSSKARRGDRRRRRSPTRSRVPAEHMALGLDVLLDIVSNSTLAPADVERERSVILEELRMYQDQPQDFVQNLFEEIMWPGHPLGRDIAGTEEDRKS